MPSRPDACDIAIIGFGPTGATLAHLLGLCGLTVIVLEKDAAVYPLPRAVHFDDEVMRLFQTIGVSEEVLAETIINPGMRFLGPDGRLLLDWSRPDHVGRHGWHASYRFHQPTLERILGDGIVRFPSVHVRRKCRALALRDRGDEVEIKYEDLSTGDRHCIKAAHVVGCDGARSIVRRAIGSGMDDLGFHERWLVADVRLKAPRADLGSFSIQYCDPERSVTYTRQPGNRRRWEFRRLAGDVEVKRAEQVWTLLSRWVSPVDADLERFATYAFHSLVARRWRAGRLWIAGDAAHQTPPFMGQGMCAGIRDVANLAWKLVVSVGGGGNEALHDSYQTERVLNVTNYIRAAVRLGGLINSTDSGAVFQMAQTSTDGVSRMESPVYSLGPGLGSGPDRGCIFGQPKLLSGHLMDDVSGYAPVLVAEADLARSCSEAERIKVVSTDEAPGLTAELARLQSRAALVRPDRYILATANEDTDLKAILSRPGLGGLFAQFPARGSESIQGY